MNLQTVITIDGPAASGKSTLGQLLASRLGYLYFDTGVMYRALTALAFQHGVNVDDEAALKQLAERAELQVVAPTVEDGRQYTVLSDGVDITWLLRDANIERNVSQVSRHPEVRRVLRDQQRRIGRQGRVVMVGRDIGAVVMPDAGLKVFLEASVEERARRRQTELAARGRRISYEEVLADLRRRDDLDRQNTFLAPDAQVLSSDNATPSELVDRILALLEEQQPHIRER